MEKNGTNYGWFAAGAVVGAAVALLAAPKAGRDTRHLIGTRASQKSESLLETSKEMMDKSRDLYERGRKIAEEAAELFEKGRRLVRG